MKVSLINYIWAENYEILKSKNVVKFHVYISPLLSCRVTIIEIHTNNVSNGVGMAHVIYFIATAVAPSAFRRTQYQATHYFNQSAKHIMLTN